MEQEEKNLEILLDLFNHDGWKLFIKEQEDLYNSLRDNAYIECSLNDDWQLRRGALLTLDRVRNYENIIKLVIEQNQEDHYDSEDI